MTGVGNNTFERCNWTTYGEDDRDHVNGVRLCLWTEATNGPIVHPQVIYEHGGPWCNYTDRRKLLIPPPEHSDNPAKSSRRKVGVSGEGNGTFFVTKSLFHSSKRSLICRKIFLHRIYGFTSPPKESVLRIFIALKIPSSSAGFEPGNAGSNGKHNNH
jgi:hypothetical protein